MLTLNPVVYSKLFEWEMFDARLILALPPFSFYDSEQKNCMCVSIHCLKIAFKNSRTSGWLAGGNVIQATVIAN